MCKDDAHLMLFAALSHSTAAPMSIRRRPYQILHEHFPVLPTGFYYGYYPAG